MFKPLMMAALAAFAVGAQADAWEDAVKESIDATHHTEVPLGPDAAPLPSDLTLDPAFGDNGLRAFWPPADTLYTAREHALRVQAIYSGFSVGGYWVIGRSQTKVDGPYAGAWLGLVARLKLDGSLDTSFGAPDTPGFRRYRGLDVADAVIVGDRLYAVGSSFPGGLPEEKGFTCLCVVLDSGELCPGFGTQGTISLYHTLRSLGTTGLSFGQRVIYHQDYGLLMGGNVKTSSGYRMLLVRVDPATGRLIAAFDGDGIRIGSPAWAAQTNTEIHVRDMALAPADAPGGTRLYVAGSVKHNLGDFSGFVSTLDPVTGQDIHSPLVVEYELDNSGARRDDGVSAIGVQRNGKLLLAGWSRTNTAGESLLMLGRLKTNGLPDGSFCDGKGICLRNRSWPGVVDDDYPVAIEERKSTRDIVVVVKHRRPSASDPHARQTAWQYGHNGNVQHASQIMDYEAQTGQMRESQPMGVWIGGRHIGSPLDEIMVAGFRKWSADDLDITLTRLIATDTIFANNFGRYNSD